MYRRLSRLSADINRSLLRRQLLGSSLTTVLDQSSAYSHSFGIATSAASNLYCEVHNMPSRERFLATGLVPTKTTIEPECPICHDTYDNPVTVPCPAKHAYCRECIKSWLDDAEHNTCPFCRAVLFPFKPSGMEFDPTDARWEGAVAEAQRLLQRREIITPLSTDRLPIQAIGLMHATNWLLGYRPGNVNDGHVVDIPSLNGPITVNGLGSISFHALSYRIVAMGHMIPTMYETIGQPWTQVQLEQWISIMQEIPGVLKAFDARGTMRADDLPNLMCAALSWRLEAAGTDIEHSPFFSVDEHSNYGHSLPLDHLLKYIAFETWLAQKQREKNFPVEKCTVM